MHTDRLTAVERMLAPAVLWGVEIDTRYRVLAATFEPSVTDHPRGDVADRRVQMLLSPVTRVAASLTRRHGDATVLERFDAEQLPAVVDALGSGRAADRLTLTEPGPQPGQWGGELSLEGESQAPDGRNHDLVLELADEERRLRLHVSFDEVELRDADGEMLP